MNEVQGSGSTLLVRDIKASDAQNLEPWLALAVGFPVMCVANKWTDGGIVNGAEGVVYEIIFGPGETPVFVCSVLRSPTHIAAPGYVLFQVLTLADAGICPWRSFVLTYFVFCPDLGAKMYLLSLSDVAPE